MLNLKAEELFFLGKFMNAQYIDYDYVRMMGDIQDNYKTQEKNIMTELVDQGILMEDFSGDMELDEEIRDVMYPIFFGTFESVLSHLCIENQKITKQEECRFHFLDGTWVSVEIDEGTLTISGDAEQIIERQMALFCLKDYSSEEKELLLCELDQNIIEEVLVLRNISMNESEKIAEFIKIEGVWYYIQDEEKAVALSKDQLAVSWNTVLKGVEEDGISRL